MNWEVIIGLEIHTQLATKSKLFSGASIAYGAAPNTQACALDLALPGTLPVMNREAVTMACKLGLAINATISPYSVFARKNYFYPDLPKGYQISQYEQPIVANGTLTIDVEGVEKVVRITRAHLEEDAGKSLHEDFQGCSGIDLNRAGTPLLEIVSEPDMRSAKEAVAYMKKIHSLVRYLDICDGNMQEGSLRCDANVSIRPIGSEKLGTRTELKNLNSFRFLEKAINYEVERQIDVIESGGKIVQETRLYDPDKNETRSMRSKEEANDYRYFPDPDLLPIVVEMADIEAVKLTMPELPDVKKMRFMQEYGLSAYDAEQLTMSRELAAYFEAGAQAAGDAKLCANWVMGEVSSQLNKHNLEITACPVTTAQLGLLIQRIKDNTISGKIAKQVFDIAWETREDVDNIIAQHGLKQVTDTGAIEQIINDVIANNPKQVAEFRSGKDKVFPFFVGQVMKLSKGKANPDLVNALLKQKLSN